MLAAGFSGVEISGSTGMVLYVFMEQQRLNRGI
jgi:hypothetical protein